MRNSLYPRYFIFENNKKKQSHRKFVLQGKIWPNFVIIKFLALAVKLISKKRWIDSTQPPSKLRLNVRKSIFQRVPFASFDSIYDIAL